MRIAAALFILIASASIAVAQEKSKTPSVNIKQATDEMILDGKLLEESWLQADPADDFFQFFPFDTSMASTKTIVKLTYDDKNLYIGLQWFDKEQGDYVISSLRRDYRASGIDGVTFLFDTYQDKTNAFSFGINPLGVQREGLVSNGGTVPSDFSLSWDNKWYSEVVLSEEGWTAELAIPFKTLRYKSDRDKWNFNAYRIDSKENETGTWSHIPRNWRNYTLAYAGEMVWDKPPKKQGPNIALIPFTAGGVSKNYEEDTPTEDNFSIGGDAKIALTPALNLDLTVNPDFSQVEVDRQVTNLDRFEIFFPERRQFFLENADLFASFGSEDARPFFSRRIGVAIDTATGTNVQNKIVAGARVSGNINSKLRIGLMDMQAAADEEINLPALNYVVAVAQQRISARSNISGIFVNKQSFNSSFTDKLFEEPTDYNRTAGIDLNLATDNNRLNSKIFYHRTFQERELDKQYSQGATVTFRTPEWQVEWNHLLVGENYNAEVGFVRRIGINSISPTIARTFYPQSKLINNHGPGLLYEQFWGGDVGKSDELIRGFYDFRLQNLARGRLAINRAFTYLFNDFDPTRSDGEPLPSGSSYEYTSFFGTYTSDPRRLFNYQVSTNLGQYFNGDRYQLNTRLTYRFQPYGTISLTFNYNRVELPAPYATSNIFLIGPRFDLTLTRSLFITNFVQFNSQNDNININARLQWRFKPVSDFFIVYTDNYFYSFDDDLVRDFAPRTRALVFKLTYWLNL
ncbi:MAG: DUF5916 domain-containing protein [Cyclobacteriaceae bacterium]